MWLNSFQDLVYTSHIHVNDHHWVSHFITSGGQLILFFNVNVFHGGDGTDYRNTGTGSFLEHYSQRLSAACVMHGAAEGLKAINRAAKNRIARKRRSDVGV